MFTGLVECTVEVRAMEPVATGARMELPCPFEGVGLGDSIAVNGCCLTVSGFGEGTVFFDLLTQTLDVTGLGDLGAGDYVNLERAMALGMRLGGHIVQGHVDGTGILSSIEEVGQDHRLRVRIPTRLQRYCIDKGSITLDGISLTIAKIDGEELEFWITPHTWEHTHLSQAKEGRIMNLEVDVLAKYVERLMLSRDEEISLSS